MMETEPNDKQRPEVFVSFKNLGLDGKLTRDSLLAAEAYHYLSERGVRVFFSNVSLEKLGVSAYKKAIDEALDAANILVAVGTSAENLDAQWVRYEWDGFLSDILSGVKPHGRVFVLLEGASIRELPRALRQTQVFLNETGALERLYNFVFNALGRQPINATKRTADVARVLCDCRDRDESWVAGRVVTWLARDTSRLVSRIEADWKSVSPAACEELEKAGWSGSLWKWGRSMDRPRVWELEPTDEYIATLADEVMLVHKVLNPADPVAEVRVHKVDRPSFETPPWFKASLPGGDLELVCKQCEFEDENYEHYGKQIAPDQCPRCGLGSTDWMRFCFEIGKFRTICKKCGATSPGHTAAESCPSCGNARAAEQGVAADGASPRR